MYTKQCTAQQAAYITYVAGLSRLAGERAIQLVSYNRNNEDEANDDVE